MPGVGKHLEEFSKTKFQNVRVVDVEEMRIRYLLHPECQLVNPKTPQHHLPTNPAHRLKCQLLSFAF